MKYDSTIHIAFGIRDEQQVYYRYVLSVMSQISLKTSGKVHIHILHDDTLLSTSINNMLHAAAILKQDISFYDVSEENDYMKMQNGMLYRLFLPKVCKQINRIIYLDVDILVTGDLRKLWDVDLGDNIIGSVLDIQSTRDIVNVQARYFDKEIDSTFYFNSGVLLMNLAKMREKSLESSVDLSQEYLAFFDKYPHALWCDQDFLNYKYQGECKTLPSMFNYIPCDPDFVNGSLLDNQIVIHFAGFYKPWNCRNPLVLKIFFQNMLISFPKDKQAYEISSYMSNLPYNYCKKAGLILSDINVSSTSKKIYMLPLKFLLKEVYKISSFRRFCYIITMVKMMYLYNIHYRYFADNH